MMAHEEIFSRVVKVFHLVFGATHAIGYSTSSADLAGWDSLNHVILIQELEKEFGLHFDLFDVLELTSVEGIVNFIASKTTR